MDLTAGPELASTQLYKWGHWRLESAKSCPDPAAHVITFPLIHQALIEHLLFVKTCLVMRSAGMTWTWSLGFRRLIKGEEKWP